MKVDDRSVLNQLKIGQAYRYCESIATMRVGLDLLSFVGIRRRKNAAAKNKDLLLRSNLG